MRDFDGYSLNKILYVLACFKIFKKIEIEMNMPCNCHKIGVSAFEIAIYFQQKVRSNILAPGNAIKIPIFSTISSVFSQQYGTSDLEF